ncbi:MAG: hotdog fold thioesterase [Novosphingobium sp.]
MIWWSGELPDCERLTAMGAGAMPGFLGIAFVAAGPDWLRARMPVDERTRQPFQRLHGGASVALAETVGSVAGALVVDPARFVTVGMEINANHLRPAYDGWVEATATAESLGRTVHVWTVRIVDGAGKLVCLSRFTAAVIALDRK